MIRVLDCFAGIAGFTLAGEIINRRIGKEIFKTVGFIEKDEYCQNTLRNLFPGVPLYGDIREVSAEILYRGTDVITGGFPCVDLSKSGKGDGLSGKDSGLFKELLSLSDEFAFINLRPPILVLENVSNLLDGNGGDWARELFGELASRRFNAEWATLQAKQVGSPHRRERCFIVAWDADFPDSNGDLCSRREQISNRNRRNKISDASRYYRRSFESRMGSLAYGIPDLMVKGRFWDQEPSGVPRVVARIKDRVPALKAIGNSVVPEVATIPLMRVAEILGELKSN